MVWILPLANSRRSLVGQSDLTLSELVLKTGFQIVIAVVEIVSKLRIEGGVR